MAHSIILIATFVHLFVQRHYSESITITKINQTRLHIHLDAVAEMCWSERYSRNNNMYNIK
jgi:hypothetical protein